MARGCARSACRPVPPSHRPPAVAPRWHRRSLRSRQDRRPRKPSLAPVSRITTSGCSVSTHSTRERAPLEVSPLTPALITRTVEALATQPGFQPRRVGQFLLHPPALGEAVAHGHDCTSRHNGLRVCRRLSGVWAGRSPSPHPAIQIATARQKAVGAAFCCKEHCRVRKCALVTITLSFPFGLGL